MTTIHFFLASFSLFSIIQAVYLGNNLIRNNEFKSPDIIAQGLKWTQGQTVTGWNCTNYCQIINCRLAIPYFLPIPLYFGNCNGQVLDISSNSIEQVNQIFNTQAGAHYLYVQFYLPMYRAKLKILQIYLNGKKIYNFQPSLQDNRKHTLSIFVDAMEGSNQIMFTMSGRNDSNGFTLSLVEMKKVIIDQLFSSLIHNIFTNQVFSSIISIPGSRVILGQLVSSFTSFDRLQLYYYHNRDYSLYVKLVLKGISDLLNSKASLTLKAWQYLMENHASTQQNYIRQLDYKQEYINKEVISKTQGGYGFISNNQYLVIYSLPYFCVVIILFYASFRFCFKYKFSKILRKYSFFGTIMLLLIYEGNIQQYAFYVFGQFIIFFSANCKHKIINCFILGFLFNIIFFTISLSLSFRKKLAYFYENINLTIDGRFSYIFSNGIIYLIFGAAHELLLTYPNLQLLVLGLIESFWIMFQLLCISNKIYRKQLIVWLSIIEGFNRILLQITLYVYDNRRHFQDGFYINQQIHRKQIYCLITIWAFQFILNIWYSICQFINLFRPHPKNSKLNVKLKAYLMLMQVNQTNKQNNIMQSKQIVKQCKSLEGKRKQQTQIRFIENAYSEKNDFYSEYSEYHNYFQVKINLAYIYHYF